MMPGRQFDRRAETRERERERQNIIPVIIAQTWWKKLLHKLFSWTINRLLFLIYGCVISS